MNLLNKLTKKLEPHKKKRHLLAVSGGLDSMALFHIYLHLRKHFNFDFAVAHYHHGSSDDPFQQDFRDNAFEFVKSHCQKQDLLFFTNGYDKEKSSPPDNHDFKNNTENISSKKSEALFRDQRYTFLNSVLTKESLDLLVLAHHRDDLLETRILRLLRGVGPEGLQSMTFISGQKLRPLLEFSRDELKKYLSSRGGSWLEDPYNESQKPLRNWLRKKWLKDLQDKYPGAPSSLARSLDILINASQPPDSLKTCFKKDQVILSELLCLNRTRQRQVLASYMKFQGLKNYGSSHINEVLKRLDTEKKTHTFKLLGFLWTVDAGQMSVKSEKPFKQATDGTF